MAKLDRNTSFCFENYLKEVKMSEGTSAPLFLIGSLCVSFRYLSLESVLLISSQNLTFTAVFILLYTIQRVSDSCSGLLVPVL